MERRLIERENLLRRDWIQAIADLIVTGNLLDLEKTLSVAAPFVLLHRFLAGSTAGVELFDHTIPLHDVNGGVRETPIGQIREMRVGGQTVRNLPVLAGDSFLLRKLVGVVSGEN